MRRLSKGKISHRQCSTERWAEKVKMTMEMKTKKKKNTKQMRRRLQLLALQGRPVAEETKLRVTS